MYQYWTSSVTVRRDNDEALFSIDHAAKFGSRSKGACRISVEDNGAYETIGQLEQHTPTEGQLWSLYLSWREARYNRFSVA